MARTAISIMRKSAFGVALSMALSVSATSYAQQVSEEAAERLADLEQVAGDQTGILQLNQSVADGTLQSNSLSVSAVVNNGAAIADSSSSQQSADNQFLIPNVGADVNMNDVAGNSNGIIAINQSGATGASQSNNMAIAAANGSESIAFATADSSARSQNSNAYIGPAGTIGFTSGGASMSNVGNGSSGIIAINQSAGIGGHQANAIAIASAPGGIANSAVIGSAVGRAVPAGFSSAIAGPVSIADSFNNGAGILQVNQSSGGFNSQSNLLAIAIGQYGDATAISDVGLSEVTPQSEQLAAIPAAQPGSADLTGSFEGFSGIVQVAQASGYGNSIANTMALTVTHIPGPGL